MANKTENSERFFSVELCSKTHLKNVTMNNGSRDSVLVEGTLGELTRAAFIEGEILEVSGKNGTLRINLKINEIQNAEKGAEQA